MVEEGGERGWMVEEGNVRERVLLLSGSLGRVYQHYLKASTRKDMNYCPAGKWRKRG